jgi:hypothetical protein
MRQVARQNTPQRRRGTVSIEYLLLAVIVGIGGIVGFACLRDALVNEMVDLSNAVGAVSGTVQTYEVSNEEVGPVDGED